jgi:hypothetical protein
MVDLKADRDSMNPLRSKLGDLEDQFLAFTQEQVMAVKKKKKKGGFSLSRIDELVEIG